MVVEALQAARTNGDLILEPLGRNTAAAMALGALQAIRGGVDPLLLFCPADHHIPDVEAFSNTVKAGVAAAEAGAIVTFGVAPTYPSTGYGYIEQGSIRPDGSRAVERFIEKPSMERAQGLMLEGRYLWNAGIFLCRASVLLAALDRNVPDISTACQSAMAFSTEESSAGGYTFIRPQTEAFSGCRSQSIDYAVMEVHDDIAVVPFHGQWSDVGSWGAVSEFAQPDEQGNRIQGRGMAHQSRNTFIHSPDRLVVALGTDDLIIVDTSDALLVAHRSKSEEVKDVVAKLEKAACTQAVTHRKVARPWGWYDSIDMGERFQVKRIGVKPGASLSLQKHHHRAEHWIVVRGTAEVTCGDKTFLLSENQSTYIPIGETHRLKNPGKVEVELIEVQSGSYLGEDDIVRLEDTYGRVSK